MKEWRTTFSTVRANCGKPGGRWAKSHRCPRENRNLAQKARALIKIRKHRSDGLRISSEDFQAYVAQRERTGAASSYVSALQPTHAVVNSIANIRLVCELGQRQQRPARWAHERSSRDAIHHRISAVPSAVRARPIAQHFHRELASTLQPREKRSRSLCSTQGQKSARRRLDPAACSLRPTPAAQPVVLSRKMRVSEKAVPQAPPGAAFAWRAARKPIKSRGRWQIRACVLPERQARQRRHPAPLFFGWHRRPRSVAELIRLQKPDPRSLRSRQRSRFHRGQCQQSPARRFNCACLISAESPASVHILRAEQIAQPWFVRGLFLICRLALLQLLIHVCLTSPRKESRRCAQIPLFSKHAICQSVRTSKARRISQSVRVSPPLASQAFVNRSVRGSSLSIRPKTGRGSQSGTRHCLRVRRTPRK